MEAVSRGRCQGSRSTAARDGRRIVLTSRSFGGRCCSWYGKNTAGWWANGLGRRWRRSTWQSEDRLKVDAETLRRWMLAEGLWSRERKRRTHRRRRERKEHFGELVQMDGSFHAWLEERGPEGCLIDMIDDATNTTWAQLGEQETIWAVADTLRVWIAAQRGAAGAVRGLEESVQAAGHARRTLARRGADHAVWPRSCAKLDIEADRCQFPAGEGARGAGSWHASGPLGEKTAAEGVSAVTNTPTCI